MHLQLLFHSGQSRASLKCQMAVPAFPSWGEVAICVFPPDPLAQQREELTYPPWPCCRSGPMSDSQQEHLDALPGLQGRELQGTLGASGESTQKRALSTR